ncbi:hypothetical protein BN2537_14439 [Streptomyces venezuelae]|nr:hypothetical protein BN2537_14439 [Streptomyces venezuelae]
MGQAGWCWHMGGFFRCVVVDVLRLFALIAAPVGRFGSGPSLALRTVFRRYFAAARPLRGRRITRRGGSGQVHGLFGWFGVARAG